MNVLKISLNLSLATCSTYLISATSAYALAISGSFSFNDFVAQTTFPPDFQTTVPAGTVTFNFDTDTNTGTASGFDILSFSSVNGTIIAGTGFSTFDPTTNLFNEFVTRYDFNGDGSILVDFRTNFNGVASGGVTPFTVRSVNPDGTLTTQFISADNNITSFNQTIPIPFEFSPVIGLSLFGGYLVGKRYSKKRCKNSA